MTSAEAHDGDDPGGCSQPLTCHDQAFALKTCCRVNKRITMLRRLSHDSSFRIRTPHLSPLIQTFKRFPWFLRIVKSGKAAMQELPNLGKPHPTELVHQDTE